MNHRTTIAFLFLVLAQAAHSVEEYYGRLWETFAPARYLCGLVSKDPETGFLIIDITLILFGLWCWWFPVRKNYSYAKGLIIWWIVMESINVIGHTAWAIDEGGYRPGIATVPFILILVIYLSRQLLFPAKKNRLTKTGITT